MPKLDPIRWAGLPIALRWLVMVRATVLVMTMVSVLLGVLMAAIDGEFYFLRAIALLAGLLAAHATNNLINDLVDWSRGLDQDNDFRRQYGAHVLEQGLVSKTRFVGVILATGSAAILAGLYLVTIHPEAVLTLMLIGAFFVLFYTWPLKVFALGELSVLLVWGPLMTAGSYFVMTGTVTLMSLAVSFLYGIGPTLVILGKHIDKLDRDIDLEVHTLPAVIGEHKARLLSLGLIGALGLMLLILVVTADNGAAFLVCLLSLPAAYAVIRAFGHPRPTTAPADYPQGLWPLWFSAFAFRFSRDFGGLLVIALVIILLVSNFFQN